MGTWGDVGAFSIGNGKNLAAGDGGLLAMSSMMTEKVPASVTLRRLYQLHRRYSCTAAALHIEVIENRGRGDERALEEAQSAEEVVYIFCKSVQVHS